jgi:coiled-coil domain-containing protein 130
VEGGRKRDTGEDKELQPGEIAIRSQHGTTTDPAEKDPFAKIEGKVEDKRRAQTESSRILELQQRQARDWDDPYEKSRRLRRTFRAERKGLEKAEANREALKDKMSLGLDLVDETEADRQRASMVEFGDDPIGIAAARATRARPLFEQRVPKSSSTQQNTNLGTRRTRAAGLVAQRKDALRNEITGNTRAVVDPFLNDGADGESAWQPGIKKRKVASSAKSSKNGPRTLASTSLENRVDAYVSHDTPNTPATPALVSYASDSE